MPWLAVAWGGCGLDLPSEGVLDRTRILAARAEPAQPSAGDPFSVTSYGWSPSGAPTVVWCTLLGCDPADPRVAELSALDWPSLTVDEQADHRTAAFEIGVVGVEPGMPVLSVAQPAGALSQVVLLAYGMPPEGDDVEQATLTLALAGEVANQHPTIEGVLVDGVDVKDVATLPLGETVTFEATLGEGSLESYVDEDGVDQTEEASVRWYTDAPEPTAGFGRGGGRGGGGPAFLDDGTFELTVDEAFEGLVVVVVRDGRGGVDWRKITIRAE